MKVLLNKVDIDIITKALQFSCEHVNASYYSRLSGLTDIFISLKRRQHSIIEETGLDMKYAIIDECLTDTLPKRADDD